MEFMLAKYQSEIVNFVPGKAKIYTFAVLKHKKRQLIISISRNNIGVLPVYKAKLTLNYAKEPTHCRVTC